MKRTIFISFFIAFSTFVFSQNDKKNYVAESLNTLVIDKNSWATLSKIPTGKNVSMSYDEFFKIWIIRYENKDGVIEPMKLTYVKENSMGDYIMKDPYNNLFLVLNRIEEGANLSISPIESKDEKLSYSMVINGIRKK